MNGQALETEISNANGLLMVMMDKNIAIEAAGCFKAPTSRLLALNILLLRMTKPGNCTMETGEVFARRKCMQ